jgi:hypothetical protein
MEESVGAAFVQAAPLSADRCFEPWS